MTRSTWVEVSCWLDTVQVIATRVSVIAIRDPTLRMRALLVDLQVVQVRADPSSVDKDLASGRVTGLVLETLAIPRDRIPGGWSATLS